MCSPNRAQKPHPIRWNKAKRSIDRRSYSSGRETRRIGLADNTSPSHAPVMFVVTKADAATVDALFHETKRRIPDARHGALSPPPLKKLG